MILVVTPRDDDLSPARLCSVLDGDAGAWLLELTVAGRAPKTLKLRRLQVAGWLAWLAGQGLDPATVQREHAIVFLARYPVPETRASYRACLRGFHAWLADTGRRPDDPCARLPAVRRPPGVPHPIPDTVLLDRLAGVSEHHRRMILLGRFAGLRASEIAAAHHDYLRGTPGRLTVCLRGKGGRWRELPAHPEVVRVLAGPGWVFPHGAGHIHGDTVSRELSGVLDPWTAHSLRHAFATEAYRRTRDLRLVQDWLGHASPLTTVRYIEAEQDWAAMGRLALVS